MTYKMRITQTVNHLAMLGCGIVAAETVNETPSFIAAGVFGVCFLLKRARIDALAQYEEYVQKAPLELLNAYLQMQRIAQGSRNELLNYIYGFQQQLNEYMEIKIQAGETETAELCSQAWHALTQLMNALTADQLSDHKRIHDELVEIDTLMKQLFPDS